MAEQPKILGQITPSATTLTALSTVTAPATGAVASSLVVCNWGTAEILFRFMAVPAGAADTNAHRQYFDRPVPAKDTFIATIGMGLEVTDVVRAYTDLATVSFTLYGVEIT